MNSLEQLYQQACEVELQAFKPGNVSIYSAAHDMTVDDFRLSAKVSATPLCNSDYSLGEKIFYAVKATREAVGCNTNLGIILLCAPLIQAVDYCATDITLRQALHQVLANTTVADADWAFKAIALAAPAGLGDVAQQDVKAPAAVILTEAMQLASAKDRIALQYITDYKDIFDFAVLRYNRTLLKWGNHHWAAVAVYADLLSHYPDSHIERKYGNQYTEMLASRMNQLNAELSATENPDLMMPLLHSIDQELKSQRINPGTTADMTVATVFTVFLDKFISNNFSQSQF
ncbi:MAG: triphosphoribosyl-dephospho-CoA synthase [Methylococcales bacterium]|nr:triphosphoribosyl-dephospho-CoA synthase [Methylococcales bacterium]